MAITEPLSLPSRPGIRTINWRGSGNTGFTQSPMTGIRQYFRWPGDLLRAEVELPKMERADAAAWVAWGLSLGGRSRTFLLGPLEKTPRGTGHGAPQINGSGQTGETLLTKNWTPGQVVLRAGDWMHFWEDKAKLHVSLTDVTSNAFGNATLELFPRIRVAPANNDFIQVQTPLGTFRLDEDHFDWSIELFMIYNMRFRIIEAV